MKRPLYVQFADKMRNRILNEEYTYGQLFPSERELEAQYHIDRKTIRKSLNLLVEENLLVRVKGKGTFVNKPSIRFHMEKLTGFSRLLKQEGIQVTTKMISCTRETAGYRLAKIFGIEKNDPVNKLIRVRIAEEEPIALEYTYIRDVVPNFTEIDFSVYSLYDVLEKNGQIPSNIKEEVHAVQVSGNEAQILGKEDGGQAFLVIDVTRNQHGEVIEYNCAYTNSSRIELSTQLH